MDFKELYNEHKDQVYNLALQYVQNAEDAQEITQDVFIKVHQKLADFRHDAKLSTWMYRITINASLDFLKAKKSQKRFAFITSIFQKESTALKHDHSDFNHPGVDMEQKEEIRKIFELINQLPENQRTAIILSKLEHRTVQEIAEIMETSYKSVESLIFRGKDKIKKQLAKDN